MQKPKKVSNTDSPRSVSASKLESQKKQNHNSITGMEKVSFIAFADLLIIIMLIS